MYAPADVIWTEAKGTHIVVGGWEMVVDHTYLYQADRKRTLSIYTLVWYSK